MGSESYEMLHRDLEQLTVLLGTHLPSGAVSDWSGAIVAAVSSHFGAIPHQRCLAHIVRHAKRLLPKHSPFAATQKLRWIASLLPQIEESQDPMIWKRLLLRWEQEYGHLLKEKTLAEAGMTRKWWYTHGNLRRAWRLLTVDQDTFFLFLTNSLVPKTNNALEGVNGNLKQKLGDHRGMNTTRQASFLSWYMVFTRVTKKGDLKRLWGYWKNKKLRN